jgi:DNA-directed RNA polymerase subunit RPC12/RpoP
MSIRVFCVECGELVWQEKDGSFKKNDQTVTTCPHCATKLTIKTITTLTPKDFMAKAKKAAK